MTQEAVIECILFDSRIDATKVRYFDKETGKFSPRIQKEDHYTLTDGDGRYLHHFTKQGGKQLEEIYKETNSDVDSGVESAIMNTVDKKPAEEVADLIIEWITNFGIDQLLKVLGCDSTNPNTGWKGGVVAWIEKKLGRKLHLLVCQLHTNELMLRHLIEKLDGKTDSKTGFSGPLGKMLKNVSSMEINYNFEKIDFGPDIIKLPEDVIRDLSTDQNLIYQHCKAARTGVIPRDVALQKYVTIVHSRWLTTAQTFLEMWQKEHGLEGELLDRLRTIVKFIVSVYCPMWFEIKVKHNWLVGPRHVLYQMQLFKLQSKSVQEILLPTLQRSAWNSHSESVLQTMICSIDRKEREFAVKMILKICGRNKFGCLKVRSRKLPGLNVSAENLEDMIDWKGANEPVFTCSLSKDEVKACLEKPLEVPYFPVHTQAKR